MLIELERIVTRTTTRRRRPRSTWLRRHCIATGALALSISSLPAQSPASWTASLSLPLNPLPIGVCGAVSLRMTDPATGDVPRDPAGQRVLISDFDVVVAGAGPLDVAGELTAPSVWTACACQGAMVGSGATVTATYPGATVPAARRVTGVAFSVSAPFKVGSAMGGIDPPSCQALKSKGATTGTGLSGSPVSGASPTSRAPTAVSGGTQGGSGAATALTSPALVVVVRAQWTLPDNGTSGTLANGSCGVVIGKFLDPNILDTDVAVVTGTTASNGQHLTYSPTVSAGAVTLKVCVDQTGAALPSPVQLSGRKVNVLVLR